MSSLSLMWLKLVWKDDLFYQLSFIFGFHCIFLFKKMSLTKKFLTFFYYTHIQYKIISGGGGGLLGLSPPLESVKFMVSRGFQALQDKYTFCFDWSELKTLEWNILNPNNLIWVSNGHTFFKRESFPFLYIILNGAQNFEFFGII